MRTTRMEEIIQVEGRSRGRRGIRFDGSKE